MLRGARDEQHRGPVVVQGVVGVPVGAGVERRHEANAGEGAVAVHRAERGPHEGAEPADDAQDAVPGAHRGRLPGDVGASGGPRSGGAWDSHTWDELWLAGEGGLPVVDL